MLQNSVSEPVGTPDVALRHATRLLEKDPRLAVDQAIEILKAVPGHPHARLLLSDAWRLLGDQLDAAGDAAGADRARAAQIKAAAQDPRLLHAARALLGNDLPVAEASLRAHLKACPTDVAALRMLGEVAARLRRYPDAMALLERCLELAPGFDEARHQYAMVLNRQGRAGDALTHVARLLAKEPQNPGFRNLHAAMLANLGEYGESIAVYEAALEAYPHQPKVWMSYGHSLKTAGRQADSIAAYRRAIAQQPTLGEAYWSLANLKTFHFSESDEAAMRTTLLRKELAGEDRLHFEFALGKALEDRGDYAESFAHYDRGNAIRRELNPYDPEDDAKFVRRSKAVFTADFFRAREHAGADAPDPIFIVGLPRAGSTLIEQILSSHPQVEGTMELPDVPRMAAELFRRDHDDTAAGFAHTVAALTHEELRAFGERYIADTRAQRKTDRPFFIDKMPNNYRYAGLIHLMLPSAKIIDARRHPLGCCLSSFKQHFARGQNFSYRLEDIGAYYRGYVELMAHLDEMLPGRIHRVFYEDMIDDTEAQVRKLLEHCGLPFDANCLRFFENERAVRTASSEQVRQPIFRAALDHWKHFDPWLGPLKESLGTVLQAYPAVPFFPTHDR